MSAGASPDRLRICFRNRADAAGFTVAPNVVLDDSELAVQVRFAYIQLRRHAWQDPATTVSQRRLAELCGVSARQVRAYLSALVAARLISVETGRRDGTTNRYWIEPLTTRYGEDFGERGRRVPVGQPARSQGERETGGRKSTSYPPRNSTSYPGRKPTSYNKDAVDKDSAPPPPTPPGQVASSAPSETGRDGGGGSTNEPKRSARKPPAAVDDAGLRVQLAGEGFDAEVVAAALRELALTKASTEVRYPLRYCLSVARRLERERTATQARAATDADSQARAAAAREATAAFQAAVDAAFDRLSAEEQGELRASVLEQLTRELGFAPPTHGPLLRGAMRLALARRTGLAPPEEMPEEIAELVGC